METLKLIFMIGKTLLFMPYYLLSWYVILPLLSKKRTVNVRGYEVDFIHGDNKITLMVAGSEYNKGFSFIDLETNKPVTCIKPGYSIGEWDKVYNASILAIKAGKFDYWRVMNTVGKGKVETNDKVVCPYDNEKKHAKV